MIASGDAMPNFLYFFLKTGISSEWLESKIFNLRWNLNPRPLECQSDALPTEVDRPYQGSWVQIPSQVEVSGLRSYTRNTSRNPSFEFSICKNFKMVLKTRYTMNNLLRKFLRTLQKILEKTFRSPGCFLDVSISF